MKNLLIFAIAGFGVYILYKISGRDGENVTKFSSTPYQATTTPQNIDVMKKNFDYTFEALLRSAGMSMSELDWNSLNNKGEIRRLRDNNMFYKWNGYAWMRT